MLLSKGKITEELIDMLMTWRHSGFNVFCGPRIQPGELQSMENLARYFIRAFLSRLCPIDRRGFSQERMTYIPEESKVIYQSKDGKEEKVFEALEWPRQRAAGCPANGMQAQALAAMLAAAKPCEDGCSHVPNKGEQMVRYYGFYSNVSRGKRKKQDQDGMIPSILEPDGSSKEHRKNWARLIQKIYEVDPLSCTKCGGKMKILSFIEDPEIVKKILKHLGLWEVKARPPPKTNALSSNIKEHLFHDPEYPIEAYAS